MVCDNVQTETQRSTEFLLNRITSAIGHIFFFFQNNPKDLAPSCKTDLDLLDCLEGLIWYYS